MLTCFAGRSSSQFSSRERAAVSSGDVVGRRQVPLLPTLLLLINLQLRQAGAGIKLESLGRQKQASHWFVLGMWAWWQNIWVYICRAYKQNRPSQDCVFGSAPRYCISDKTWFSEAPCTEGAVGWTPARLTRCRRPREDKVPLKDRVLHLPLELTNHLGEICNQDLLLLLKIFLQLKPRLVQSHVEFDMIWHVLLPAWSCPILQPFPISERQCHWSSRHTWAGESGEN